MADLASDLRRGNAVRLGGDLLVVIEMNHVRPGKGPAYLQGKMRSVTSGAVREQRFRVDESIERVFVERRKVSFSYRSGDDVVFMDDETYEEYRLHDEVVGEGLRFFAEGETIEIAFADGDAIAVEFPEYVTRTVTSTMEDVKKVKVTNQVKPAMLDTNIEVPVPVFIKNGDVIRINVATGKYHERASTG